MTDVTLASIQADLEARDAAIEKLLADANGKTGEELANIKAALQVQAENGLKLHASLIEVSQKMADQMGAMGAAPTFKSFAADFAESDAFKKMAAGESRSARFTAKGSWHTNGAVIGSGTTGDGNGGALLTPDYQAGIIRDPDRPLFIRDLLMPGRTSSQVVQYFKETGFTNAADFVSENTRKPQSDIEFEYADAPVRTIAHFVKATNQILSDVPMLMSYIDSRLRFGVKVVEDNALLNGSGAGQSIEGLKPQATAYDTSASQAGDTMLDTLHRAFTQASLAYYPVDWVILHPRDWEQIVLQKDDESRYIWANPGSATPTSGIWGRRVVSTTAQTEGEFTVGARMAAQIFDREDISVEIATENEDDFVNNRCTIRAENRLALAVYRENAIIDGNFPQT